MEQQLLLQILSKLDNVQVDITSMKSDITSTKSDITAIQSEISSMQDDIVTINRRLANTATKDDVASIHMKLDGIMEQVAKSTEHGSAFHEVAAAVQEHETDIKLIKKVIAG